VHSDDLEVQIGKGINLRDGGDVTIIATGAMVGRSMLAADKLTCMGINARVLEIHTIKPLDVDLICQAAAETGAIVTAEEHSILGGLGGAVAETLAEHCPTPVVRVGIADTFALTAFDPETLMDAFGLAVDDVVAAAETVLQRK
jgi:transketolase